MSGFQVIGDIYPVSVKRLTSSRPRKRDGIPPLARWFSCFVESRLPWFHAGLVLPSLHRLLPSRRPCGRFLSLLDT